MRRNITFITALLLTIMLSFSMIQPTYAASSRKPAAPKITSVKTTDTTVTIKWKKARNAKKYEIAKRFDKKSWVKYKTVKKTRKNKKKYTKANKYKVVAKGKKYIVYKYGYRYSTEILTSKKKRSAKIDGLVGNNTYTFAIRSINGKKRSAWKKITFKTKPTTLAVTINGKSILITQGQKSTLPIPAFNGVTINKNSCDIIPSNDEFDLEIDEEYGGVTVRGKDPSGFDSWYVYRPGEDFGWGREEPSLFGNREKLGYVSYGSRNLSLPEELIIDINNPDMKAVWTLDGTEPQLNQTDKFIDASEYPFGKWTKGDTIRIHGTTTESCKVSDVTWTDSSGFGVRRSAPIVIWVKLYHKTTLVMEMIKIEMS